MRHLATIQKIKELNPIDGADNIEVATIKGWKVVVKKGEFTVGQGCVYFEIDSLLPLISQFDFLGESNIKTMNIRGGEVKGYRLKTVKLRGQISQGLALPLGAFADVLKVQDIWEEGCDVSDKIGVFKYEAPIPANLAGKVRGNFPSFIPKTDEERIQNCEFILEKYKNIPFYITEKLDGTSCTVFIHDGELHVCSRNLDLERDENNTYWKVVLENDFERTLLNAYEVYGKHYAIQGEIVGEGIQKNPLKLKGQHFYAFNIYDMDAAEYLDFPIFEQMCTHGNIKRVPVWGDLAFGERLLPDVDSMVNFATKKSTINNDVWMEGLVWRPMREIYDSKLGRLSFKVINPQFLLKHE